MRGWVRWAEVWHRFEATSEHPITECGLEPPGGAERSPGFLFRGALRSQGAPCSRCARACRVWQEELAELRDLRELVVRELAGSGRRS